MKRRNFVRSLMMTPAVPAALAGAQAPTNTTTTPQPKAEPATARQMSRQPTDVPHLDVTAIDLAGQPAQHYFTDTQFATLHKLGDTFMPPLKTNPGATEAQAPEFLDFLISASPADRQKLYLTGLDNLDAQARDKYQKPFAELSAEQVDAIVKPLMVVRPWPMDFPSDPVQNFIAQVHEDLRTATMNSREWAAASEQSGHRFTRGFRGKGFYWSPIDPISEG
ncbi:MAG: gluconate 2-dehydrogenase subunit 3 family protein [Bryobacteraceae bacterium]